MTLAHLVPLIPPRVFYRFFGVLAVIAGSILLALTAAELVMRWKDRYVLFSVRAERLASAAALDAPFRGKWIKPEDAQQYLDSLPIAPGTKREWFFISPPPPPAGPADPDLVKQWNENADGDQLSSLYVWNLTYRQLVCARERKEPFGTKRIYVFEPPHGELYPRFRYIPEAKYPTGLRTNRFGFRGPEISLKKPANVIRIAFVGASTTVGGHSELWSYPELVGRWLNEWAAAQGTDVRFEIINAAHEGDRSMGIAATVEQEVVALAPDLIVYYEGANQFQPSDFVRENVDVTTQPFVPPHFALDDYSALSRRLHTIRAITRDEGREPPKRPLTVNWPADLSEKDPDLHDPRLPVKLPQILGDLDHIRAAAAGVGAETALSSFMWLVYDGMTLNLARDFALFDFLNRPYGNFSYAHMRRYADFQNRVFEKYARVNGLPFIDLASEYPRDPRLFYDAIHMSATGIRVQAWIMFQHLVPMAEERMKSGRWPSRQKVMLPAPQKYERRMISIADIVAACRS